MSLKPVLLCLSGGFYLLFINQLLSFKTLYTTWYKIITRGAKASFIIAGLVWAVYFLDHFQIKSQIVAYNIFATGYVIFSLFIFYKILKINNIYSKYVFWGSFLYFLGASLTFFLNYFYSIPEFSQKFGIQLLIFTFFGIMAEALIFALIIGIKNQNNEIEKIKAIENEKLQSQKLVTLLKDQETQILNAMIEGQEIERHRLATEIHDNIGASLSALRLRFEFLEKIAQKHHPILEQIIHAKKILLETYNELRTLSHTKNNGVVPKFGLVPAIQKLLHIATSPSIKFDLKVFNFEARLSSEKEINIFRIIQELINNIIKHSMATETSISLTQEANVLNIIIEDNGQGFDFEKVKQKGMGLQQIKKRIQQLNGQLEIDSNKNMGTTIIIDIPL